MANRRFPLFVDLTGRKAVVIGGGTVGLRRARLLRRFGAAVVVISPALADDAGELHWLQRAYRPGDLEGAYLAVAASDCPEVNAAAEREARTLGVLFNRSDCPSGCDFFFPAICEGEGLTAGLVGDGSDHRRVAQAAQAVRAVLGNHENIHQEENR